MNETNVSVQYNTEALIGAVGPSVWAKLGPEKWFPHYKIVVANSRDYSRSYVHDLHFDVDDFEFLTTENIVLTPEFMQVASTELRDYRFIAYKPVATPNNALDARFIANDVSMARYEDKKVFRETFGHTTPMPPYTIDSYEELFGFDAADSYARYAALFGSTFVLQDNRNGGGRGTHIVRTPADMQRAMDILQTERKGTHVVVSQFIDGVERSVQVFVSNEHVVRGPLQQQLVRNEELLNPQGRGGMYFCGGKFIFDAPAEVERQIDDIIARAAERLRAEGYRGIFGIDFLVDADDKAWTIEINARTTGVLPLLNEQQTQLPLYLLHILELADEPYQITNTPIPISKGSGPGSFVILFNTADAPAWFDEFLQTGNYRFAGGKLVRLDTEARWNPDSDCLLQMFVSPDYHAKPNLKLCNIFLRGQGFDTNGVLTNSTRELLAAVKAHILTN